MAAPKGSPGRSFGRAAGARPGPGKKVFISVDMEGIAGVVTGEQLGPRGFEYGRFREFMTDEALAAIEGAREAGATEFVVADSHGNGAEPADRAASRRTSPSSARGRARSAMMEGIDETFDGGDLHRLPRRAPPTPQGVRAHTIPRRDLADVRAQRRRPVPEAGLNAAIAGHFGVPVVMISGDDAAVDGGAELLGPIEGAVVK